MINIRNTIAKELGIYSEYEQLKTYYREIQEFNKKREATLLDLYTLYIKTNNKEDAYRKAAEDTDYFFEQRLGKELYSDLKLAIEFITKRMNLLRMLM